MRPPLAALLFLALAACAGPAPYGPAEDGGPGHAARRIEPGRWRVSYLGDGLTARDTVENRLLRRAAEVTLAEGADHFVIVARDVERRERARGSYIVGAPWGGWSSARGGWVGVSLAAPATTTRYAAFAEILARRGPPPPDDRDAYDARAVLAALGAPAP